MFCLELLFASRKALKSCFPMSKRAAAFMAPTSSMYVSSPSGSRPLATSNLLPIHLEVFRQTMGLNGSLRCRSLDEHLQWEHKAAQAGQLVENPCVVFGRRMPHQEEWRSRGLR